MSRYINDTFILNLFLTIKQKGNRCSCKARSRLCYNYTFCLEFYFESWLQICLARGHANKLYSVVPKLESEVTEVELV
jgi:hypothetical protein